MRDSKTPRRALRAPGPCGLLLLAVALAGASCGPAYYKTMETFGLEKRHLLVDRVKDARSTQQDAREQYRDALEVLSDLIDFEGGNLEKTYRRVERQYERSVQASRDVRARIDRVEKVAEDLFREWGRELERYEDPALRVRSEASLEDTRDRYAQLIAAMHRAATRIEPALQAFEDQVLYLKHNLNAQAIGALASEVDGVRAQIDLLIVEIERSIAESEQFLSAMES